MRLQENKGQKGVGCSVKKKGNGGSPAREQGQYRSGSLRACMFDIFIDGTYKQAVTALPMSNLKVSALEIRTFHT